MGYIRPFMAFLVYNMFIFLYFYDSFCWLLGLFVFVVLLDNKIM